MNKITKLKNKITKEIPLSINKVSLPTTITTSSITNTTLITTINRLGLNANTIDLRLSLVESAR